MLFRPLPTKGYATVGIKPAILLKLEKDTDEYYPGMFLPSALIIIMNEIKRGFYSVETNHLKIDYSGRYTSLTIRADVKTWLKENYEFHKEEYTQKYKTRNFTQFASFFMLNMFKSKSKSHKYVVNIKESDFLWLQEEYKKKNEEYREKYSVYNFDQFADLFIKDIFEKLNQTKKF
ncbi:MAG TPA: hypothetical protein VLA74_03390 [Nitrososphaeraceae archaeon]|nr:hypothetical protein [Nitrososphaeraceae archaeon]